MPPFESNISQGLSYTAIPITKSDSTVFDPPLRCVDVVTGGDVVFTDGKGVDKTITVGSGYTIKCLVTKIKAASTATGFIGYP